MAATRACRADSFLHELIVPTSRGRFLADEASAMADAGLSDEERDLLGRRDWRGLIHYGASFFMLEKLDAVVGVSNLHIYAAMRGESLEQFQQTRNAPGALYSVAGKDASTAWDQKSATRSLQPHHHGRTRSRQPGHASPGLAHWMG